MKTARLTLFVLAVSLLSTVWYATPASAAQEGSSTDSSCVATPSITPESTGRYQTGELVRLDNWEIYVSGASAVTGLTLGDDRFYARGVFVLVNLIVTNVGNEPAPFPYRLVTLTTDEGNTYTLYQEAMFPLLNIRYDNLSETYDLQPDLNYRTGVIFDVALTASGATLALSINGPYVNLLL